MIIYFLLHLSLKYFSHKLGIHSLGNQVRKAERNPADLWWANGVELWDQTPGAWNIGRIQSRGSGNALVLNYNNRG